MTVLVDSMRRISDRSRPLAASELRRTSQAIRQKACRFLSREISFVYDPSFESLDYAEVERIASGDDIFADTLTAANPPQQGLPAYIASLYAIPLLTAHGEAALFRKMNFLKYSANAYRSLLDPQRPNEELIDEIEVLLEEAERVKSQLVQSNLRLVVSIARRFAASHVGFDELVSEGNFILMKAVEKFDYARGFRFSTYVTHAVQRHFYRHFRNTQRRRMTEVLTSAEVLRDDVAANTASPSADPADLSKVQELMSRMDACLDDREQYIIRERFGFNPSGQIRTLQSLSEELGICKERVRQLHHKALVKLRELAAQLRFDPIET